MGIFFITVFLFVSLFIQAQDSTATIKGQVLDAETGDSLMFANILLGTNGEEQYKTSADIDGFFEINNISPGIYEMKISYAGYKIWENDSIYIEGNTNLDPLLTKSICSYNRVKNMKFIDHRYYVPLIDQIAPQGLKIGRYQIQKAAIRLE